MASLIRTTSLSSPGTTVPCRLRQSKLGSPFNRRRKPRLTATWALTPQLMQLLRTFKLMTLSWPLILLLSKLLRRLSWRLSKQAISILTLFKRTECRSLRPLISYWLHSLRELNRLSKQEPSLPKSQQRTWRFNHSPIPLRPSLSRTQPLSWPCTTRNLIMT